MTITPELVRALLEKATPGPWRVGAEGSEGSHVNPDSPDKRERVRYIAAVNGRVQPQDGYNARLIAAAPDIAKAYLELIEELDMEYTGDGKPHPSHNVTDIVDGFYVCECGRQGSAVKPGDPPIETLGRTT